MILEDDILIKKNSNEAVVARRVLKLPNNSNSNGNISMLPEQKKRKGRSRNPALDFLNGKDLDTLKTVKKHLQKTKSEIVQQLSRASFQYCCGRGTRSSSSSSQDSSNCCILQHFGEKFDETAEFIMKKRAISQFKGKVERWQFIQSKFISCILCKQNEEDKEEKQALSEQRRVLDVDEGKEGSIIFKMQFEIDGIKMCRKQYLFCYGFTAYEWDRISKLLKENGDDRDAIDLTYTVPTDAQIPPIKRNKIEQIWINNVVQKDEVTGEYRLGTGLPDQEMITAALSPMSAPQANCIKWLEEHFGKYSEFSPSDLTAKVEGMKKSIYKEYMKAFNYKYYVQEKRFNQIWATCLSRFVDAYGFIA